MKQICISIVLSLLVIACSSDKPKKPENLIPKEKMEQVLYDLYIINAAKGVNRKLLEHNGFMPETYVLTKYNIDSIQFRQSNDYYAFDAIAYKNIVENVKKRLEKDKIVFEKLQKTEGQAAKRRRDSLSKINTKKKDSIKKINKEKAKS